MRRAFTAFTWTRADPRTWSRSASRTFASRSRAPPTRRTQARGSPVASVWDRVAGRTRSALAAGLRSLKPPLTPGYYEELEEVLVSADIGPAMAARLVSAVQKQALRTREEAAGALVNVAMTVMSKKSRELIPPLPAGERVGERVEKEVRSPAVILFYGINGAGKTTTIGKLGHRLKGDGRKPLIVAADTFRAAGIEQMAAWARRAGVDHFEGKSGADPASVVLDGIDAARSRGSDGVLVDTAGRPQTQPPPLEERAEGRRGGGHPLDGPAAHSARSSAR